MFERTDSSSSAELKEKREIVSKDVDLASSQSNTSVELTFSKQLTWPTAS